MRIRLNAEILLCLPEHKELTEEERGGVILGAEGKLNEVGVFTTLNLGRVGIRVHIKSEKAVKEHIKDGVRLLGSETGRFKDNAVKEIPADANCANCEEKAWLEGTPEDCPVCQNTFCAKCINDHVHCEKCEGTGKERIHNTIGNNNAISSEYIDVECTACDGTGLEE